MRDVEEQEVLKKLKDGEYPWEISDNAEANIMFDTSEVMEVEENEGNATIEFYNDNGEIIWNNAV